MEDLLTTLIEIILHVTSNIMSIFLWYVEQLVGVFKYLMYLLFFVGGIGIIQMQIGEDETMQEIKDDVFEMHQMHQMQPNDIENAVYWLRHWIGNP